MHLRAHIRRRRRRRRRCWLPSRVICQIEGIWSAKDMDSLDRPERRELIKTDREASTSVSRLQAAGPCARAIAEVFYVHMPVREGWLNLRHPPDFL